MNKRDLALYIIFILIIALAFFLRLYHLDERVFHHDEAAVGYFTYKLFNDNVYSYDPSFHGPFMYYATSEMYRRFGDSIYSSRLIPALLGAGMLFLLFPLRKYTGNAGMVLAAFFLALSASFLYYSRFYREDIFISFFTLLGLVCVVKYAENHSEGGSFIFRISYLFLGGVSLASMAALKENAYIAMGLIAGFLFLYFIRERWYKGLLDRLKNRDRKLLIPIAEAIFLVLVVMIVFSLFYTGKVLDLNGMAEAVRKAITHWYEMHKIQRMGGPYFFYLPIMALYELPVLVFGILGMFDYGFEGRKKEKLLTLLIVYWLVVDIMYLIGGYYPSASRYLPTSYIQSSVIIFLPLLALGMIGVLYIQNKFHAFLIYWVLSNFFVYSYVQEKVPWLVLNPLLPLVIIAACYLGELLPRINFHFSRLDFGLVKEIIDYIQQMLTAREDFIHILFLFFRSRIGAALLVFLVVSMAFFVYSSLLFNFYRYTDASEPLIQASQPPQKFSIFLDKVKEISSQYQNQSTPIQLTDVNLETQFLWYMRYYPNIKWKVSLDAELDAPLIVVHDSDGVETEADVVGRGLSPDYKRLNSSKMSWYWFKSSDITLDYLLFRKMDRGPGEYRFVLYYKPKIENN